MTVPVPLRALVIEHDDADAELVLMELRRAGFAVDSAIVGTVEAFTAILHERVFDIVLSDYRLPSWTGMDALIQLRALGFNTPLILVTGTLGDERAVECVKRGVADYIIKDNLARLPLAVTRALDEKLAQDEREEAGRRLRRAEAERLEREQRFTQLADNISEVFFLVDAEFRQTLYINRAYEAVWGRSCQSLYDNPGSFLEALLPDDVPRMMENIDRIQRGEDPGNFEFRVVRPDGTTRWLLSHAIPIRDGSGAVYRISGVILDITDRREAQRALVESEARYRTLTEASFDAIAISQDGIILEVNAGFGALFGYAPSEIVGRTIVDCCAPESMEAVRDRVIAGLEGTYEMVGQRKDGRKILIESTAKAHFLNGRAARITALRDLTERRQLEEQYRQAQKMEAVGRLAGGVAHDFNNLLTIITGYATMVRDDLGVDDPNRQPMEQILKAGTDAAALTRQLLLFSRQQVIVPRVVGLDGIVQESKKMLQRVIGEDIVLITAHGDTRPTTLIDPGEVEQMVMNLAVNARDAMPTGGTLTIRTGVVDLSEAEAGEALLGTPGRFAMLSVSDTGIGMDADTRGRIFEPFFTTKPEGTGTGLGLATVYGVVKARGGSIRVQSELGQGTTFTLYLPYNPGTVAGSDAVGGGLAGLIGSETILLAEDAAPVRGLIRHALERLGYRVLEAPTGEVAVALAASNETIDLLLTDVVMPGMSGRVLAERFEGLRPGTRMLYMSGYTDDAVVRHGISTSSVAYLQKPFTPEALGRRVREVLDAR